MSKVPSNRTEIATINLSDSEFLNHLKLQAQNHLDIDKDQIVSRRYQVICGLQSLIVRMLESDKRKATDCSDLQKLYELIEKSPKQLKRGQESAYFDALSELIYLKVTPQVKIQRHTKVVLILIPGFSVKPTSDRTSVESGILVGQEVVSGEIRIRAAAIRRSKLLQEAEASGNSLDVQIIFGGRNQPDLLEQRFSITHCGAWAKKLAVERYEIPMEYVHYVDSFDGCTLGDIQAFKKFQDSKSSFGTANIEFITTQFHLPRAYSKFVSVWSGKKFSLLYNYREILSYEAEFLDDCLEGDLEFVRAIYDRFKDREMARVNHVVYSAEQVMKRWGNIPDQKKAMAHIRDEYIIKQRKKEWEGIKAMINGTYSSKPTWDSS